MLNYAQVSSSLRASLILLYHAAGESFIIIVAYPSIFHAPHPISSISCLGAVDGEIAPLEVRAGASHTLCDEEVRSFFGGHCALFTIWKTPFLKQHH